MSLLDNLGLQVGMGDEETDVLNDAAPHNIGPPGPLAFYLAQPPLLFPSYSPTSSRPTSTSYTPDQLAHNMYAELGSSVRKQQRKSKQSEPRRSLSALRLAMLAYFFTCGGPFGIETSVGAAGALTTFIAFVAIPWVWSVPQALMSAELALMMPQNGGNVLWVRRAFGNFGGWVNAYNFLICSVASLSLYPILFFDYLPTHVQNELDGWQVVLIKLGFVVLGVGINLWGITWISRLSLAMLLFIVSPFLAEFIAAYAYGTHYHWNKLLETKNLSEIQWGVFLSTVLWSYGGYDSVGSVAGEVKGGRPTFIKGISASLPLAIANYFAPVAIGYSLHPQVEDWQSGFFTKIAYDEASWLGIWMVAASCIANTGTYIVTMASLSRVLWATGVGPSMLRR
eukprot:TRINITY_DN2405_c0_g1_i1.p1 TRINITY_DN2405_c0_g1~~TRINITY_DN2405_c0_g1_i1.p1  ORF type:complete len:396 (+),score=39.51 TRINITY_DN2405_c0_g1_i1:180-1367(+)